MQPFDKEYFARREKQIQEMYMERSQTWACLVTGLVLGLISIVIMPFAGILGPILLVVAMLFLIAVVFMFFSTRGQMAADQAIQKEYERLLELNARSVEKPKRDSRENAIRLSEEGELIVENSQDEQIKAGIRRNGQDG
ncbi:MAG TPA: hypothetical protein VMT34_17310 [Aggregatilineales bacterium]|nr:hypothetical protein [Aggregatilineales bacterium]